MYVSIKLEIMMNSTNHHSKITCVCIYIYIYIYISYLPVVCAPQRYVLLLPRGKGRGQTHLAPPACRS